MEVLFVVDHKAVEKYTEFGSKTATAAKAVIKEEVAYYIKELKEMFTSIPSATVDIELLPRDFVQLDEDVVDSQDIRSGNKVNTQTLVKKFQKYLEDKKYDDKYKYDMALLYTGFDIYSGSNPSYSSTAGYSWVGGVCKKSLKYAVVEIWGTFGSSYFAAHELGHALGASHDSYRCGRGHIMASILYPSDKNRWTYSDCTADYIKKYVQGLGTNNCMQTTSTSSQNIKLPIGVPPGMSTVSNICHRKFGKNAVDCSRHVGCSLTPLTGGAWSCKYAEASDGMKCTGGICNEGRCVSHRGKRDTEERVGMSAEDASDSDSEDSEDVEAMP